MSLTVQQLIDRGQKLVTVAKDDTVQLALQLMTEHDYSQLPVIDREGKIVEDKGKGYSDTRLQKDLADQAFKEHMYLKEATKPFDRLTLNQYIDLFLHESRWSRYSPIFSLDRKHIRNLLDSVRKVRNDLAHFRSTVSNEQHDTLIACKEWLERKEPDILKEFDHKQEPVAEATPTPVDSEFAPVEEAVQANESRYASLALFLRV